MTSDKVSVAVRDELIALRRVDVEKLAAAVEGGKGFYPHTQEITAVMPETHELKFSETKNSGSHAGLGVEVYGEGDIPLPEREK